jgi:hypothetical protein
MNDPWVDIIMSFAMREGATAGAHQGTPCCVSDHRREGEVATRDGNTAVIDTNLHDIGAFTSLHDGV